jgi:hypothetical protein
MIKLHPEILKRDGKEQFAVIPWEEFVAIQEALEDLDDLRAIDEAKASDDGSPGLSSDEMRSKLGLKPGG